MALVEYQVIQACQQGDLAQFGLLYDKYIKKIYDFIYFKTHHKETAQDLTSIVFVKAMQKINTFDNKSNFSAWLYRIARNTVIDHFRVLKKDKNIDDIWDLADNSDIAQDIDIKNKLAEVKKYLKNLKSDQRDIVIMRLWQNMSYAEIAQTLGKSEDSCKMSFSRTIKNLRGEFILAMLVLFITR